MSQKRRNDLDSSLSCTELKQHVLNQNLNDLYKKELFSNHDEYEIRATEWRRFSQDRLLHVRSDI